MLFRSKGAQDSPKMAPRWLARGPDGPKTAPKIPRKAPEWPQDAPKSDHHGRSSRRWCEINRRGNDNDIERRVFPAKCRIYRNLRSKVPPKECQNGTRWPQDCPREAQDAPKMPPECPKNRPRGLQLAQDGPRMAQQRPTQRQQQHKISNFEGRLPDTS